MYISQQVGSQISFGGPGDDPALKKTMSVQEAAASDAVFGSAGYASRGKFNANQPATAGTMRLMFPVKNKASTATIQAPMISNTGVETSSQNTISSMIFRVEKYELGRGWVSQGYAMLGRTTTHAGQSSERPYVGYRQLKAADGSNPTSIAQAAQIAKQDLAAESKAARSAAPSVGQSTGPTKISAPESDVNIATSVISSYNKLDAADKKALTTDFANRTDFARFSFKLANSAAGGRAWANYLANLNRIGDFRSNLPKLSFPKPGPNAEFTAAFNETARSRGLEYDLAKQQGSTRPETGKQILEVMGGITFILQFFNGPRLGGARTKVGAPPGARNSRPTNEIVLPNKVGDGNLPASRPVPPRTPVPPKSKFPMDGQNFPEVVPGPLLEARQRVRHAWDFFVARKLDRYGGEVKDAASIQLNKWSGNFLQSRVGQSLSNRFMQVKADLAANPNSVHAVAINKMNATFSGAYNATLGNTALAGSLTSLAPKIDAVVDTGTASATALVMKGLADGSTTMLSGMAGMPETFHPPELRAKALEASRSLNLTKGERFFAFWKDLNDGTGARAFVVMSFGTGTVSPPGLPGQSGTSQFSLMNSKERWAVWSSPSMYGARARVGVSIGTSNFSTYLMAEVALGRVSGTPLRVDFANAKKPAEVMSSLIVDGTQVSLNKSVQVGAIAINSTRFKNPITGVARVPILGTDKTPFTQVVSVSNIKGMISGRSDFNPNAKDIKLLDQLPAALATIVQMDGAIREFNSQRIQVTPQ